MGGIVDTLFGGGGGKGSEDLEKYIKSGMAERTHGEERAEQAFSPYMGNPRLQEHYEQELGRQSNPQEYYNSLFSGYQQSPFAKAQTEAGMNSIQHSLAAQGMHGSGQELMDLQKNAQNISSADQQQYLNNLLGIRGDYMNRMGNLQSQESEHQYGARGQIGNWRYGLGNQLGEDYGAMGKARANQDQQRAGGLQGLFGTLGRGALGYMTGGPMGALGSLFGSQGSFGKRGGYGGYDE